MDEQDVELVKQIVTDTLKTLLPPIEDKMTGVVMAAVRQEVRQDHSENRTRLQFLADEAAKAAEAARAAALHAAEAVVGQRDIMRRLDKQDEREEHTVSLLQQLIGDVKGFAGHKAGMAEAGEISDKKWGKIGTFGAWLGGVLASSGIYKMLANHFHWPGGK